MELRKLALCVAALALLGTAGCKDGNGTSDMGPDMSMPCNDAIVCNPVGGSTYQYVIHRSELSLAYGTSRVAQGFDLDCTVSDGSGSNCVDMKADFMSCDMCTSPVQGIDNALAALIPLAEMLTGESLGVNDGNCSGGPADAFDILQTTINSQALILLLEVSGVDDLTTDDCVGLRLTLQDPPDPLPNDGDCPNQFGGGLTFTESPTFADVVAQGEIVNGRLRVIAPSLPLAIPLMGAVLELTINAANVEGDITATTIDNGVIGGAISRQDMLDLVGTFLDPDAGLPLESIVDGLTDLNPDPMTGLCQGLSMGITFAAADATF